MTARRLKLALFALTGIGNVVLERLVAEGLAPDLVVTRAEPRPYPYEPLPFIGDNASGANVAWTTDTIGERDVTERGAELLLLATYHRRVGAGIAAKCEAAINLHPALLPRNRGPNPFFWSIRNGDATTGVTAHRLADKLDAGDICAQQSLQIGDDETQSSLRRRLAHLAADIAVTVVRGYRAGTLAFHPQTERDATSYPRVDDAQRQLAFGASGATIMRQVNALRDWPLALLGDRRVLRVVDALPPTSGVAPGAVVTADGDIRRVRAGDSDVILQLG
jgi:methionyl-tRNA formyltransferase